jgi:hypothetical protein
LLAQKKVTQEKGTLEDAVSGHPCPLTPRAGSGVRRQYVHVLSTNSPPSWRRSLRDFSSTCSPRPGGTREKQSAAVPAAEALLLLALDPGPSVQRRRSAGQGRVPRTRGGPGRPAFGDRAGALPPNPGRPQRTGRRPARNRGCISLVTFFVQAKKVTRPPGRRTKPHRDVRRFSRQRRESKSKTKSKWIPAFAGMTAKRPSSERRRQ